MVSLLTLLDDIASTLDEVAIMTKTALHKTSALMSDDLAVNAGVIDGVNPDKELPMVLKIFWGSLINKVICIFAVLLLNWINPFLIKIVLVIGGAYLSFEGVHKIYEKLSEILKRSHTSKNQEKVINEDQKIRGAIKTDLILSIEIIVIAQNQITGSLPLQLLTLSIVGLAASIIIYGLVALVVKIDDFGLYLIRKSYRKIGLIFVKSMPYIMKGLGIVGTAAMLLVGGGIFTHTFHLKFINPEIILNLIIGFGVGAILTLLYETILSFRK